MLNTRLLKEASTPAPEKAGNFQCHRGRVKVVEKEMKMAQCVLKRQLAWMVKHEVDPTEINDLLGQNSS